jgi:uncharacterized protein (TIGR02246 family)
MKHTAIVTAGALAITLCTFPGAVDAGAGDEANIRALEARFAVAFNAKDVDAIMKVYVPGTSLVVFDLVPPRQYVGAQAYRKDWETLFATFKGPVKFEISDLAITADRTLAYSHSIQHLTGTDVKDRSIDMTVRVTDVYRKIKGQWLITHEHVSVPVDIDTGKPDLTSKP